MVPTFREHGNVDDHPDLAGSIRGQDPAPDRPVQVAMDDGRRDVCVIERRGNVLGMSDGGAEDDRGPIAGFLLPMPDHLVGDRGAVHDACHLCHVEIRQCLAHRAQFVLHSDVDDKGARRHEMAGGDQFTQPDLVTYVVEDLTQALAVAAVRRRGDAEDPAVGIGAACPVDDPAIAVSHCMVRFVDHQQI